MWYTIDCKWILGGSEMRHDQSPIKGRKKSTPGYSSWRVCCSVVSIQGTTAIVLWCSRHHRLRSLAFVRELHC